MRRHKMSKHSSKSNFRHGASHTHVKNINTRPMRGGIRL